ncbi:hypothetical protein [Nocardia sp. NPDC003345]
MSAILRAGITGLQHAGMTAHNSRAPAPRTAAVIGADPMGVTSALGLLDAGFEVALYSDRDQRALRHGTHPTVPGGGIRPRRRPGAGIRRTARIRFDGYVGVTVDYPFETGARLGAFLDRGGAFLVEFVTPESLGEIAATTDLTFVAGDRGGLTGFLPVTADRPLHRDSPGLPGGLYVLAHTAGCDRAERNPRPGGQPLLN